MQAPCHRPAPCQPLSPVAFSTSVRLAGDAELRHLRAVPPDDGATESVAGNSELHMGRLAPSGGGVASRVAEQDITSVLDGRPMGMAMEYEICVLSTPPECQAGGSSLSVMCNRHPAVTEFKDSVGGEAVGDSLTVTVSIHGVEAAGDVTVCREYPFCREVASVYHPICFFDGTRCPPLQARSGLTMSIGEYHDHEMGSPRWSQAHLRRAPERGSAEVNPLSKHSCSCQ